MRLLALIHLVGSQQLYYCLCFRQMSVMKKAHKHALYAVRQYCFAGKPS